MIKMIMLELSSFFVDKKALQHRVPVTHAKWNTLNYELWIFYTLTRSEQCYKNQRNTCEIDVSHGSWHKPRDMFTLQKCKCYLQQEKIYLLWKGWGHLNLISFSQQFKKLLLKDTGYSSSFSTSILVAHQFFSTSILTKYAVTMARNL